MSKNFYKEEIKKLLTNWEDADGCLATDKILVDGRKVGFCYREEPDEDSAFSDYDSGWRFLAGDETDEYIDDANNSGIYKLNTLCNYDEDILEIINAPYGSAFEKDENGKWRAVENFSEEEKS